jgi:hypothetical protein
LMPVKGVSQRGLTCCKTGPFNPLCVTGNMGKFWTAWGQYENQDTSWGMNKYRHEYNYLYNFTCMFPIHYSQ